MKYLSLKTIVQPGLLLSIFLIVAYTGMWVVNYWMLPTYFPLFNDETPPTPEAGWTLAGIYLITIINLLLINNFNYRFALIRTRTFMPVMIYALLILTWKQTHFSFSPHLSLTIFIVCLMLLLSMYRNKKAVEPAFLGSLLIAAAGIWQPLYILLIPFMWVILLILKAFSLKIFLASVIGTLTPWLLFIFYQYIADIEFFNLSVFTIDYQIPILIQKLTLIEQIYLGFNLIIFIISIFSIYSGLLNDAVQTRKNIHIFVILSLIFLFLIIFYQKEAGSFLPMLAFVFTIIISHPFSLNKSQLFPILFLLFAGVNLGFLFIRYFIL